MGLTGWNLVLMPYAASWRFVYPRSAQSDMMRYVIRAHRRSFEDHFRASSITRYESIQLQLVHGLLKRLLNEPDDFMLHMRQCVYINWMGLDLLNIFFQHHNSNHYASSIRISG